jgi:hypothetical protein
MIEIESTIVKLGETEYTINQAGFLRAKPWKKRLIEEVQPIFGQIGEIQNFAIDTPGDLLKLIPLMETLFLDGIETVFELLIAYSAELEAARADIEAHATDKQILAAFQEVIKLADPFGVIPLMVRRIGL